ncbi:hypothetical protein HanRHA438_Chr16g0761991 [Helianthus annuus]|nr:hypothetical protein HanRHA438_Chr16g0761991 [Helianthus annuus]
MFQKSQELFKIPPFKPQSAVNASKQENIEWLKKNAPYPIKNFYVFQNWDAQNQLGEVARVKKFLADPTVKVTSPNWKFDSKRKPTLEEATKIFKMNQELIMVEWAVKISISRWKETTMSKEFMDYMDARKKNTEQFPPRPTWDNTESYLAQKEFAGVPFKPREISSYNPRIMENYLNNLKEKHGYANWIVDLDEEEKTLLVTCMPDTTRVSE